MPGGGLEFACEKPKEHHPDDPEHVLKTLQSLETTDEKLSVLCKKYSELLDEHKTTQNTCKHSQRTLSVLSREKDQLQSEHSKAVLAKSKLESLCRELQRHNKLVKDESIARAKEDDEKRKEVTAKFQTTINDIQQQMNDHYGKNMALREENIELANKLKGLIEQYELREAQIDKIFKSKELESQLYDAKLQQAALQINEEKEKHLQDKQLLLRDAMESQQKIMLLEEQEKALKAQVAMYSEKYEDFQSTLTRSNDVFTSFKSEMEKMSKKIKKLEKDTVTWRQKWESSNKALLEMAEQKARSDKDASLLQNKVSKLESLCRALQEERKGHGPGQHDATEVVISQSSSDVAVSATADRSEQDNNNVASNESLEGLNDEISEQEEAEISAGDKSNNSSQTLDSLLVASVAVPPDSDVVGAETVADNRVHEPVIEVTAHGDHSSPQCIDADCNNLEATDIQ